MKILGKLIAFFIAIQFVAFTNSSLFAQKLKPADVPADVVGTLEYQYPSAKVTGWLKDGSQYVASIKDDGSNGKVYIKDNGDWIRTLFTVPQGELPSAITEYVKKNYPEWIISVSALEEQENVKTHYYLEVKQDGIGFTPSVLTFSSTGKNELIKRTDPEGFVDPTKPVEKPQPQAKEPASKIDFANAISVIDASTSAAVGDLNKIWSGDVLELSFATSLSPSHQYTVTMADVADTEGYNITKFADKVFTTLPNIGVAVTPADTAVDVATNSTIVLAFDYDIGWTGTAAQYNLLHLKKESVELSYFANYDSTSKVLTLTPTDKFEYLTDYTLSVGAFGRATGQTVVARDYTFTTVAHTDGIASITTPIGSIIDGLYTRHPLFDISFINQKPANTSAVESAITVTNASTSEALSTVNKSWNNGVLTIGFSEMLDMSTEYTISLATVKDTENYDMVSFTPEINVAMTLPVEGSLSNATSTPIVLTFDYDIEWTGMPGELESVKINSGAVDYTAVYNSASKSLTLSPSPKLNICHLILLM